jgi:hypothetical protein
VIISDLQHIEFATKKEVQGGGKKRRHPRPRPWYLTHRPDAKADPFAFGTDTGTCTSTDTSIIEGQFSDFDSSFECF